MGDAGISNSEFAELNHTVSALGGLHFLVIDLLIQEKIITPQAVLSHLKQHERGRAEFASNPDEDHVSLLLQAMIRSLTTLHSTAGQS